MAAWVLSVEARATSVLALLADVGEQRRGATTPHHSRMSAIQTRVDSHPSSCTDLPKRFDPVDPQCAAPRFGQAHPARAGALPQPPDLLLRRGYSVAPRSCSARRCTSRADSRRCTYRSAPSPPDCSAARARPDPSIRKGHVLASPRYLSFVRRRNRRVDEVPHSGRTHGGATEQDVDRWHQDKPGEHTQWCAWLDSATSANCRMTANRSGGGFIPRTALYAHQNESEVWAPSVPTSELRSWRCPRASAAYATPGIDLLEWSLA